MESFRLCSTNVNISRSFSLGDRMYQRVVIKGETMLTLTIYDESFSISMVDGLILGP